MLKYAFATATVLTVESSGLLFGPGKGKGKGKKGPTKKDVEIRAITWNVQPIDKDDRTPDTSRAKWATNYAGVADFLTDKAQKSDIDFFGLQEFGNGPIDDAPPSSETTRGKCDKGGGKGRESVLTAFIEKNEDYDVVQNWGHGPWYGVQVVYNRKRWTNVDEKRWNSFPKGVFRHKKKGVTKTEGRPCVAGLFRKGTTAVYGVVASCHIEHCQTHKKAGSMATKKGGFCDDMRKELEEDFDEKIQEMVNTRVPKVHVGFKIIMGDFNELGHDVGKGEDKFFGGFNRPSDNKAKTLGNNIADRILYSTRNLKEEPSALKTYVVSRPPGSSGKSKVPEDAQAKVDQFAEVSDHRPRKIVATYRLQV